MEILEGGAGGRAEERPARRTKGESKKFITPGAHSTKRTEDRTDYRDRCGLGRFIGSARRIRDDTGRAWQRSKSSTDRAIADAAVGGGGGWRVGNHK